MSKLSELVSKVEKLSENLSFLSFNKYTTHRDEDAKLFATFDDEVVQFPVIPFRLHQTELAKKLYLEGILRIMVCRPRRSGKEIESWNLLIEGAVERPGLYIMVYPTNVRARAVLWDGAILYKGISIRFLDMVPKRFVINMNNQDMKIKLINGSILWVMGSDIDPDKLRGTNPLGMVLSEFAYQDPRVCYVMMPALRQSGGWLIGQSTFDGMNHFYQMIENNKNDPLWYCRVDSIINLVDEKGNRYITDAMIEEDRRAGMPEYLIQQEYYGIVQVNQETKYFAHAIKFMFENDRFVLNLAQPNKNIYTFWDLGVNDKTAIILVQFIRKHDTLYPHVIGYIENNNREFKFYIDVIRQFAARAGLVVHSHFAPHDGAERDFYHGLKDIRQHGQELGEFFQVVKRPPTMQYGIELIRQTLHLTYIDKGQCQRLIDCLSNYSKEYNEKHGVYKDRPVHDWSSHAVKAFQTMAIALHDRMINDTAYEVVYYNR